MVKVGAPMILAIARRLRMLWWHSVFSVSKSHRVQANAGARRYPTFAFALVHGVICPTGCFVKPLSSPLRKNISLSPSGKSSLQARPVPPRSEGRTRRHERWVRDAMDAVATQDERRWRDGEVVWFWRPDAGVKFREAIREATVARKPGHREEHEGNR
jgi:hypothetical protein